MTTKTPKKNERNTGTPHGRQNQTVHIEFNDPAAESVAIAGTFNDWRPDVTPMLTAEPGRWVKNLSLPPGTYQYCLVVNGYNWMPDPQAHESAPNPYGGRNSVLRVPEPS